MKTEILEKNQINVLIEHLNKGEVVGFPTETVYGLAIVYDNKDSFNKLAEAKQRPITKPISMMVSKSYDLNNVAYITPKAQKVIDAFMPGALTIVLKAKENLPEHVTMKAKTIGIRIPTNDVALDILSTINKPLLVTSANISNHPALMNAKDVYDTFNTKIAALINEDAINGVASTVIDMSNDEVKILREGPISLLEIEKVLEE